MNLSITLTPSVIIANRVAGKFGIGELVTLGCVAMPAGSNVAAIGGVDYKVTQGSGSLSTANTPPNTAIFTAAGKVESVQITASGKNAPNTKAVVTLNIVAPTSLKFTKVGNIKHTNGSADAGFKGTIALQPPGVSYQRLKVREGEFKGKGTGYYAGQQNMVHPASAAPLTIINGNQVNGLDTIYSGIQGQPWSSGTFEWNIPWEYQMPGSNDWIPFGYANHVQEITAQGAVSIGKFNAGPFSAKPSDPTQP